MISFREFLLEAGKAPRASTVERGIYKSAGEVSPADAKKLKELARELKSLDADPKSLTGVYAKDYNRISKAKSRIASKYSLTTDQLKMYS